MLTFIVIAIAAIATYVPVLPSIRFYDPYRAGPGALRYRAVFGWDILSLTRTFGVEPPAYITCYLLISRKRKRQCKDYICKDGGISRSSNCTRESRWEDKRKAGKEEKRKKEKKRGGKRKKYKNVHHVSTGRGTYLLHTWLHEWVRFLLLSGKCV